VQEKGEVYLTQYGVTMFYIPLTKGPPRHGPDHALGVRDTDFSQEGLNWGRVRPQLVEGFLPGNPKEGVFPLDSRGPK